MPQMDRIAVRKGATVGANAVLLHGADIGINARIAPHSVVMKHEHLRSGVLFAGFPTRRTSDPASWKPPLNAGRPGRNDPGALA